MKRLPQRPSLVTQTAAVLREAIASGEWARWMPGELELARRLHVSRVTLRGALAQLEREKLISAGQGRRRQIVRKKSARPARASSRTVVLLSPDRLHRLPGSTVFWMDELREHLDAAGWPLEIHESAAAYRHHAAHAIEELAARLHPAGWVLYRSTPEMQGWFSERAEPAIIAGSRHPGVALPSVDVDYAACCRHAAGRFLAEGHTRLAIVRPDTTLAGDLQSVAGFQCGAGSSTPVALHDGSVAGICASLAHLFTAAPRTTGLFVFHAPQVLTVLGWLHRRGIRVPRDVSLVCRDHEPFLESVIPTVARYTLDAASIAHKISRLVLALVGGGAPQFRQHHIMPSFVRGETLAAAVD